jgi:hypothetical protein
MLARLTAWTVTLGLAWILALKVAELALVAVGG